MNKDNHIKKYIMIKLKRLFLFIGILICCATVSCKKFLEEKQNPALTVPSTLRDAQALLDYSAMVDPNDRNYTEIASDNFVDNSQTVYKPMLQYYTWQTDNTLSKSDGPYYQWTVPWQNILYTNTVLEVVNKVEKTSANAIEFNNVKGEALFFRAYWMWKLAIMYAKAYNEGTADQDWGLPIRLTSDFNIPSIRRNLRDTYKQILEDATNAALLLNANQIIPTRPAKAAGYGLLARIHLSMRNYEEAGKSADLSLQQHSDLMNYNDLDSTSGNPIQIFNKETLIYTKSDYSVFWARPLSSSIFASFAPNDLRAKINFSYNASLKGLQAKGSYTGSPYSVFTGIATDEVFLMRAECYARAGKISEAMTDLNTLMAKRYDNTFVPFSASNAEDALNIILDERRKELLFRGLRWMDLKRLNLEGRNIRITRTANGITYILEPNSSQYAISIPKMVIDLTGMPQN